jgi:hypothetical protein
MVATHPKPMKSESLKAPFIYITGCDGTGKTTQARLLVEQLKFNQIKAKQIWLRFPFLFSLPLLAYARWRKLSWYEDNSGERFGYWDFSNSALMRIILPWTLLIDAAIGGFINIFIPIWMKTTIVCERFVLDMLVDLEIAFNDFDLHNQIPGKYYFDLLPSNRQILILDLDLRTLHTRRKNLVNDKKLEIRLHIFRNLAKQYSIPILTSNSTIKELNNQIITRTSGMFYQG